jgi:hypothetical protein
MTLLACLIRRYSPCSSSHHMVKPLQVVFRGMKPSTMLEGEIAARVEWIAGFYPRIVGCRVLVERPHRHRARGRHIHVRIELSLPGEDVVVSHAPTLHARVKDTGEESHRKDDDIDAVHKDAVTTIHEAFDTARRRLQEAARRQRGDVKVHHGTPSGTSTDSPAHA